MSTAGFCAALGAAVRTMHGVLFHRERRAHSAASARQVREDGGVRAQRGLCSMPSQYSLRLLFLPSQLQLRDHC
eukprot:4018794-Lingulodinium_polyedra.AAC.1